MIIVNYHEYNMCIESDIIEVCMHVSPKLCIYVDTEFECSCFSMLALTCFSSQPALPIAHVYIAYGALWV